MDRVLDGFTTCLNFRLSDRAPPDKIALAEGGTVPFVSIERVSNLLKLKEAREGFLQLMYALGQFKIKISCV